MGSNRECLGESEAAFLGAPLWYAFTGRRRHGPWRAKLGNREILGLTSVCENGKIGNSY
jgi:hypothetical protein